MKLSELKQLVAILEDNANGVDTEVVFSDYSRRGSHLLTLDRPVREYLYSMHVPPARKNEVHIPLDIYEFPAAEAGPH